MTSSQSCVKSASAGIAHHFDIAVVFQESGDISDSLLRIKGDRRELRELARCADLTFWGEIGTTMPIFSASSWIPAANGAKTPPTTCLPSLGQDRHGIHVASLNGSARPTKQNFFSFAKRAQLDNAEEIFEKASDSVRNWPSFAKQAGLRDANIKRISKSQRCL